MDEHRHRPHHHDAEGADGGRAVLEFRREKDDFFRRDPRSPLTRAQRAAFAGLAYFPPNPELVIEGRLEPPGSTDPIDLATTTGEPEPYVPAGVLRFSVGGRAAHVMLYASPASEDLFLPFRDATSGARSYAAGRYLEVPAPEDGWVLVDFNYAYNPYCAYNDGWRCPLPPADNWLEVPIEAGERAFPGAAAHDT